MAKPASNKSGKKGGFWKSKAAVRAIMVFGVPVVGLLGWYFYTVAGELNKPAMNKFEAELAAKMKKLLERKVKLKHYDACQNMVDEYTTPKGWNYSDADLYELVGLSKRATKDQLEERCIFYAKVVENMEKMSHHTNHVYVCKDAFLDVGSNGKQYIKADKNGRGAMVSFIKGKEDLLPITRGKSTVFKFWQIYNVGDGCIIVGLSKKSIFRMSGYVVRDEKAGGGKKSKEKESKKKSDH